ncbi:MAG: sigma-70 family RNA polymerase sigma factor, partial [Myxococcota bacterium]
MNDSARVDKDVRSAESSELAVLYREYRPFIRRALQRHYVSPQELDDVTHDVFVVLLRKLDEETRPRSIRGWLGQVARRVAANHHRGDRRRTRKDEAVRTLSPPSDTLTAEDAVARQQAHDSLRAFIEGLDDEACAVFVMSEVEGLRGADIAARLGLSLPMTYARIRTVRARFEGRFVRRRHAAWAGLSGSKKTGIAAVFALAFALGRRTKIVVGVAALLGLLWLLRGLGSESGGTPAPPPGTSAAPVPVLGEAERGHEPLASADGDRAREAARARGLADFGGIVVDPRGDAVSGAVVCGDRIRVPGHLLTAPPLCTTSAADGRFAIHGATNEPHTLAVMAEGFSPAYAHSAPRSDVRIVVHPGGTALSGRVVDVYGGPVADAWVAIENVAEETLGAAVRTDDDGRFSMWAVEGPVPLAVGALDYASSFSVVLAPSKEIVVRLSAESVISGIVVDSSGVPAPGIRVAALLLPGPDKTTNRGGTTFSNADGRWELRGLQPHEYVLDASGAQSWGRAGEPIDLGIGDRRSGIEIKMIDGADLVGRIVDAGSGAACPEGFVTTLDKAASITREGRTDAEGWVVVPALSGDARYRIAVSCRGYETKEFDVDVAMGPGSPHEWALTAGRTLAVTMRASSGDALADWRVRILMPKGHRLFDHRSTWQATNREGVAEFTGLPEGTYGVRADGPGGGPMGGHQAVVEAPRTEIEITADPGVAVTGVVVGGDGDPLARAVVTLQRPFPEISKLWGPTDEQLREIFSGGPFRATTNAAGEFRLSSVPPGDYDVHVASEPSTAMLLSKGAVDNPFLLAEEDPLRRVVVAEPTHLELRLESLLTIAGVVSDEQDDRLEGTRVFVMRERDGKIVQARSRPRLTDEEGRYAFDDLHPGTYAVAAYRPGGGVARVSGIEAGEDADLVFPRLGRIAGRVESSDGKAVPGYQLFVRQDGDPDERFVPVGSSDGEFSLGGLSAGRYQVRAQTEREGASVTVELGAGEVRKGITLTLVPRTHLRGRLVD